MRIIKMENKNTSISLTKEDRQKIVDFINEFKDRFGFKISIAEFVKEAIKDKLKQYEDNKNGK
jgi:sulfur relay (sulfurtransferase) DsrC/TusE family protein